MYLISILKEPAIPFWRFSLLKNAKSNMLPLSLLNKSGQKASRIKAILNILLGAPDWT